MTLGGGLIVDLAFWKREAVMNAWMNFELTEVSRFIKQRLQLINHWQRCQVIELSA